MRVTVNNIKINIDKPQSEEAVIYVASKLLRINEREITGVDIRKRSIDARHKDDIRYVYTIDCEIRSANRLISGQRTGNVTRTDRVIYEIPTRRYSGSPIIIGAGPAGLFCAYLCALGGIKPIIIERGQRIEDRRGDVDDFWETGVLKPDSNVQFGEGGAGAFSDGKLNTLITDKAGRCRFVLETLVRFGAPVNILYDAKPHLGTDVLSEVIGTMRRFLTEEGVVFKFGACVKDLLLAGDGAADSDKDRRHIAGVVIEDADGTYEIMSDRVALAIGHSARDTFKLLYDRGIALSPKAFAVGLRCEHPRRFIDIAQYGTHGADILPAAAYKLTAKSGDRGVYSFCMCPGGYVLNSSSEEGLLAVNGMSYSGRSGDNSNAAIIVTVTPDDYPSADPLAGVEFQRMIERRAYEAGRGAIPVQRLGDYAVRCGMECADNAYESAVLYGDHTDPAAFMPACKGMYRETDISGIMPPDLNRCIIEGMRTFDRSIRGFAHPDVYMSGIESRTSSPVRIDRDDVGESISVKGLYPCGEGAGYAGGITSAAMDGMYIAERILNS